MPKGYERFALLWVTLPPTTGKCVPSEKKEWQTFPLGVNKQASFTGAQIF